MYSPFPSHFIPRNILTVNDLEVLATRIERAEEVSQEREHSFTNEETHIEYDLETGTDTSESEGSSTGNKNALTKIEKGSHEAPLDPKRLEAEHEQIIRLRSEGACFHCESPEHLARNCPHRRAKVPRVQLNSVGMSATKIKLAALYEGQEMGLFVVGNKAYLMGGLPGEYSEVTSAGHDMLGYFDNLQSETESDTKTGVDHSQNSESNDDKFEDLPDLEPTTDSEDEQNDSIWYSYGDLLISCSRRNPNNNGNSPRVPTVCNGGAVEDSEDGSIHSRRTVVPNDRILSEQLEGKSILNFSGISESLMQQMTHNFIKQRRWVRALI